MFKNLVKILTTDCEVIQFNNHDFFYPIFKNGSSSLKDYAFKNKLNVFKNKEISHVKKITVFMRDPEERFASGIHTFFYFANCAINKHKLKKIENFDIVDKHFIPQYLWLVHLQKHFDGVIKIKSVDELYNLIPNRDGPWTKYPKRWKPMTQGEKDQILSIKHEKYVQVDKKIIKKYMNKSVELKKIITEFKN